MLSTLFDARLDLPEGVNEPHYFQMIGREQEIGLRLISFIQVRTQTLPQRILILGEAIEAKEEGRR